MVNDTVNFIAGFGIIPNDWSCKTANEICTKFLKGLLHLNQRFLMKAIFLFTS